ncbi:MAG: hypothetical protein NDF57_07515 [archaeon GBS-70-058]|nr:hypothetical protein [Candidatus Culexarchaeum nevadense]
MLNLRIYIYYDSEVGWGNVDEHCSWYENKIKNHGGIDVQVLGIGGGYYDASGRYIGGHIGFNEPGSPFDRELMNLKIEEIKKHKSSINTTIQSIRFKTILEEGSR